MYDEYSGTYTGTWGKRISKKQLLVKLVCTVSDDCEKSFVQTINHYCFLNKERTHNPCKGAVILPT